MTLTIEQLERISYAIAMGEDRTRGIDGHAYTELTLCGATIRSELHRRKRGPFTLAEAIASGRPFRRKAWSSRDAGGWVREISDEYSEGTLRLEFVSLGYREDHRADSDDITATDYELQEVQP